MQSGKLDINARAEYWNRQFDIAFRRVRWHLAFDALIKQIEKTAALVQKYAPDQPRIPAGQTGGGQWTDDGGSIVRLAGGFEPHHLDMTVQEFRSKYCRGNIRAEMPNDFNGHTIAEVIELQNTGNKKAKTCIKLLSQDRFRK